MPLSQTEKTTLVADAQAISDAVNALVPDGVNPLQAQLDAALATIAAMKAKAQEILNL